MNKPTRRNLGDPSGIPGFLERSSKKLASAKTSNKLTRTRANRVERKYPIKDVLSFLGITRASFDKFVKKFPSYKGEAKGREVLYTSEEIMRIRVAYAAWKSDGDGTTMHWRSPGDRLPVIVIGSQKGGSGKSITTANCALFMQQFYGLRVLVLDGDPQATATLYFADQGVDPDDIDTQTFTNFMGLQDPGEPAVFHSAEELNSFFVDTPWPGIRLLPGGPSIQESDISLFLYMQKTKGGDPSFATMLREALRKHDEAYQPKSKAADLVDRSGNIIEDRYQAALKEAFDVVIIDCQPALSMAMLNAIVAGTSLIIPTPLKGWDLHTTKLYTTSAFDLVDWLQREQNLEFPPGNCFILPAVVSTTTAADLITLKDLLDHDSELFCPVFYKRSDAVANAAEVYQSLYEYVPPKGKKKSTEDFIEVANAVGDAIVSKCIPHLPSRGFANEFIEREYGGAYPAWVTENPSTSKVED